MINIQLSGFETTISTLTKEQTKMLQNLKGRNFVYFLMKDCEIVYIGVSKSINIRFQQHRAKLYYLPNKEFDSVIMLEYKNHALAAAMERVYQLIYPTPLNNPVWTNTFSYADLDFLHNNEVRSVSGMRSEEGYWDFIRNHPRRNQSVLGSIPIPSKAIN